MPYASKYICVTGLLCKLHSLALFIFYFSEKPFEMARKKPKKGRIGPCPARNTKLVWKYGHSVIHPPVAPSSTPTSPLTQALPLSKMQFMNYFVFSSPPVLSAPPPLQQFSTPAQLLPPQLSSHATTACPSSYRSPPHTPAASPIPSTSDPSCPLHIPHNLPSTPHLLTPPPPSRPLSLPLHTPHNFPHVPGLLTALQPPPPPASLPTHPTSYPTFPYSLPYPPLSSPAPPTYPTPQPSSQSCRLCCPQPAPPQPP